MADDVCGNRLLFLDDDPAIGRWRARIGESKGRAIPATGDIDLCAAQEVGATVLAVEDDPASRRGIIRQLRQLGYEPIEADGPAMALALLECVQIDLLFADIAIPGPIDGIALARQIVKRCPTVKVVLTSGSTGTRLDDLPGPVDAAVRLLSKPYRVEELAGVLRESLGG